MLHKMDRTQLTIDYESLGYKGAVLNSQVNCTGKFRPDHTVNRGFNRSNSASAMPTT